MLSLFNIFEEKQLLKKRKYPAFSIPKDISVNFAKKIIQHLSSNNLKPKIAAKTSKTFDLILSKNNDIVES